MLCCCYLDIVELLVGACTFFWVKFLLHCVVLFFSFNESSFKKKKNLYILVLTYQDPLFAMLVALAYHICYLLARRIMVLLVYDHVLDETIFDRLKWTLQVYTFTCVHVLKCNCILHAYRMIFHRTLPCSSYLDLGCKLKYHL